MSTPDSWLLGTCRGAWLLGSACGQCQRCKDTIEQAIKDAVVMIREQSAEVRRLKEGLFCIFDNCEDYSWIDTRAVIADILDTTVKKLENRA